jgi:transposase
MIEERFMIRDMYRTGVSVSEIARRTGRDRKTIRHIVTAPDVLPEAKPRQAHARKIDPYLPYLEQRIEEGVLNARKLYGELRGQGYAGGETQVRDYVHRLRPDKPPEATMRFETPPGEQGQVDWGHFGFIEHDGCRRRLYAFVLSALVVACELCTLYRLDGHCLVHSLSPGSIHVPGWSATYPFV